MASQHSRYEEQQIVNSFNFFLDSEKASLSGARDGKGDNVNIHLGSNNIVAADGEYIRISLLNFTMFNNTYMINNNNNLFRIKGKINNVAFAEGLSLTPKNYENLKDIATNFADAISTYLVANSTVASFEKTNISPATTSMSKTDNRLLDITLTAKNGSNATMSHLITEFNCITGAAEGDSYLVLGARRRDDSTDDSFVSFKITATATTIRIQGFYPMQRLSDPYVYLRCGNASNAMEQSVLSGSEAASQEVMSSDILAKLFKDVEYITYNSSTGDEFFITLQQRKLSSLRLFLTDSKGRSLGRRSNQNSSGTCAGLLAASGDFEQNDQSTLGNLNFTGVLRIDIIRNRMPVKLETERIKPMKPQREAGGILTWQDYGNPKY